MKPAEKWELIKSNEKMKVYTKNIQCSKIKQVKVEGIMECSLEKIIFTLNRVEDYPKWIYGCVKSFQFKTISKDEYHYYIYTDMPFPFKDRDLIVHTIQWFDNEGKFISSSISKPNLLALKNGAIRIRKHKTLWKIKKISENKVKYTYTIFMDPGGILPAWLINLAIDKGPVGTIKALEKYGIELEAENIQ